MDQGYIVLIDAAGLRGYPQQVITGYLVHKYLDYACKRGSSALHHLLVVEEAQALPEQTFAELLQTEANTTLGVGLVTKDLERLAEQEELKHLLSQRLGTLLCCGQVENTEMLEQMTKGYLTAAWLEQLPENTAAALLRAKLRQRSKVTTCVLETDPILVYDTGGQQLILDERNKQEAYSLGQAWGLLRLQASPGVTPIKQLDEQIAQDMMRFVQQG
jgi:hypothetical protein